MAKLKQVQVLAVAILFLFIFLVINVYQARPQLSVKTSQTKHHVAIVLYFTIAENLKIFCWSMERTKSKKQGSDWM